MNHKVKQMISWIRINQNKQTKETIKTKNFNKSQSQFHCYSIIKCNFWWILIQEAWLVSCEKESQIKKTCVPPCSSLLHLCGKRHVTCKKIPRVASAMETMVWQMNRNEIYFSHTYSQIIPEWAQWLWSHRAKPMNDRWKNCATLLCIQVYVRLFQCTYCRLMRNSMKVAALCCCCHYSNRSVRSHHSKPT